MRYYPAFPEAIPHRGVGHPRVTHPSATERQAEAHRPVRLACVTHAASVCPEPGSNSPISYACRIRVHLRVALLQRLRTAYESYDSIFGTAKVNSNVAPAHWTDVSLSPLRRVSTPNPAAYAAASHSSVVKVLNPARCRDRHRSHRRRFCGDHLSVPQLCHGVKRHFQLRAVYYIPLMSRHAQMARTAQDDGVETTVKSRTLNLGGRASPRPRGCLSHFAPSLQRGICVSRHRIAVWVIPHCGEGSRLA